MRISRELSKSLSWCSLKRATVLVSSLLEFSSLMSFLAASKSISSCGVFDLGLSIAFWLYLRERTFVD